MTLRLRDSLRRSNSDQCKKQNGKGKNSVAFLIRLSKSGARYAVVMELNRLILMSASCKAMVGVVCCLCAQNVVVGHCSSTSRNMVVVVGGDALTLRMAGANSVKIMSNTSKGGEV